MNRQAIFEVVATNLLYPNRKSRRMYWAACGHASCAYRGTEGMSCAVGCLIPDEEYSELLEGANIRPFTYKSSFKDPAQRKKSERLQEILKRCTGAETDEDYFFLYALQIIHDECPTENWYDELEKFAAKERLDVSFLLQGSYNE